MMAGAGCLQSAAGYQNCSGPTDTAACPVRTQYVTNTLQLPPTHALAATPKYSLRLDGDRNHRYDNRLGLLLAANVGARAGVAHQLPSASVPFFLRRRIAFIDRRRPALLAACVAICATGLICLAFD